MKRTVAVLMFLFVVLLGALFPFEKTKAAEMSETFYNEQGKEEGGNFKIGKDYLELSAINVNDTKVGLNLKMNVLGNPAVDLNKNGKFDADEADDSDAAQTWDSIFDNDLENSSDGVFLVLTKKNASGQYVLEKITTGIKEVDTDSYHEKANDSSVNIGYLIYGKDPTKFFGKNSLNINIPLVGLDKSTEYKAYIVVYEDGSSDEAIGNEITFKTLSDADTNVKDTEGGAQDPDSDQVAKAADMNSADLDCSIVTDGFVFCSAVFFYSVSTYVTGLILSGAGMLFDAFVLLSINSDIYNTDKAVFVYTGWKIVKDISNIFFIFVLLYTAIGTMLGLHDVNYKKVIVQVIMMGLLINFSLFFTRVIIDTGNVFAQVFYNAITIDGATDTPIENLGNVKQKSISRGIQKGINPQKILFPASGDAKEAAKIHTGQVFLIALVVSAFNLVMAWVFFMSAAFFVGRIGVLWMSMLFSPLAFASNLLPSLDKGLKQLGMHQWLSGLMSASFKAPIFMFLIYIIITLTQGAFIKTIVAATSNSNSTVGTIIAVLVPMMIIMGLLMQAKNIAKDMAGQFGEVADGVMKAAVGVGAMAITGGAAMAGRSVFGANAMKTLNNEHLKNLAAGSISEEDARKHMGFTGDSKDFEKWKQAEQGRAQKKLLDAKKTSEKSYDLRQTVAGNLFSKTTGVDMNTGSGLLSTVGLRTSTDDAAGGARASSDRRKAKAAKDQKDIEEVLKSDPTTIHAAQEAKEEAEKKVKKAEEELEAEEQNIKRYKDTNPNQPVPPAMAETRNNAQDKVKALKKGGSYIDNMTQQNISINKSDSLKGKEDDLNYKEKGRIKEYWKQQHHNAEHMADESTGQRMASILRSNTRTILRDSLRNALIGGGVGTAMFPGIGTLAGTIVGGVGTAGYQIGSGVLESLKVGLNRGLVRGIDSGLAKLDFNTNISGYAQEKAELVEGMSGHFHAKSFKSEYKSPNKGIFDMFSGLGSGGGHGGGGHGHDDHGHDNHGGGHDDHGGHH